MPGDQGPSYPLYPPAAGGTGGGGNSGYVASRYGPDQYATYGFNLIDAQPGSINRAGGGGGGVGSGVYYYNSGAGGSGIVIIRYLWSL
jgi:hypothetical protein